jgi:signal transduction histidine kinase
MDAAHVILPKEAVDGLQPSWRAMSWRWPYWAVAMLFITLMTAGTFFYQSEASSAQRKVRDNLDIVSSLKVAQIVQWRRELLGNAEDLASQPHLVRAVTRWLRLPNEDDLGTITTSLKILKGRANLNDVMIVDTAKQLRLNLVGHADILDAADYETLAAVLRDRRPAFTGLHPHIENSESHVDVIAPFVSSYGEVVGAVIIETEASDFLYPMLASWPTASTTAETLLVHRVDDAVEFLNPPRHHPEAVRQLRIPLDRTEFPAVRAVLGQEGIVEGTDYRGESVLAVLRPIPDTPWFLVTKIDSAEAFADWHSRLRLLLLLMATLTLATLAGLLWLRKSADNFRELSRAEAELRDHKSHLEETVAQRTQELKNRNELLAVEIIERRSVEQALREAQADLNRAQVVGQIGSWRLDVIKNRLTWSPENHRIFGVPEGTVKTYETFLDVVHPEDRNYVDRMWRAALRGDAYDIEHRLLIGDEVKWVREKAELEFAADGMLLGGFGTTQDITERRLAKSRLEAVNKRLADLAAEQAADLRELAGELTRAEQKERDRLYELLHDEVQPLLVAARLALSGINEDSTTDTCVRVATDTCEHISKVLAAARTLSTQLSPPLIRERGLGPALESLCRLMASHYGLKVDFACDPDAEPTDIATRLLCFNAVRELLLNAVKHAGTGSVELNLQLDSPNSLRISVVDRGQGFDTSTIASGSGTGLPSIKRRLGMIGGRLTIDSRPGEGTTAVLWAPIGPSQEIGNGGEPA